MQTKWMDLKQLPVEELDALFMLADRLKEQTPVQAKQQHSIALLFFEPSTRTRISFQFAAQRMGLGTLRLDDAPSSSLEKGETIEDSIRNVAAMGPRVLVIRAGQDLPMADLASEIGTPVVNAGWGTLGHPTQALLDLYTLRGEWSGALRGKKLLFVGDSLHSRVVASHLEVLPRLGMQAAFCGPQGWIREGKQFSSLEEGMAWADAAMVLRCQFERHGQEASSSGAVAAAAGASTAAISLQSYREKWMVQDKHIQHLPSHGVLLHPGPANRETEISSSAMIHKKSRILVQVANGVVVREALLRSLLGQGVDA